MPLSMSSYVTSAPDSLLPFSSAFSSPVSPFQYNPTSSRDVLPSNWSHAPLVAAALMYQNGPQFRTTSNSESVARLSQEVTREAEQANLLSGPPQLKPSPSSQRTGVGLLSEHVMPVSASASIPTPHSSPVADDSDSTVDVPKLKSKSKNEETSSLCGTSSEARAHKQENEEQDEAETPRKEAVQVDGPTTSCDQTTVGSPPCTQTSRAEDAHLQNEGQVVEESASGVRKMRSTLCPEVPEFVPRPALTTLPAALNLQKNLKSSKSQQLSADVPEFVPLTTSTFQPAGVLKPLKSTSVVPTNYTPANSLGPGSTSSNSSRSKASHLPGTSQPLLLRSTSKGTGAGATSAAVLSHTSPSFTPSATASHIAAASVVAVASHAGVTCSGQGMTAVLIPNSILQSSSLLLSTLPVNGTGLSAADATGQGLGMACTASTSFGPTVSSSSLMPGLPLQVSGPQAAGTSPKESVSFASPSLRSSSAVGQTVLATGSPAADSRNASEDSSKFGAAGSMTGGKQSCILRSSCPSTGSQAPLPTSSRLSSSSPVFVPSTLLKMAHEAPLSPTSNKAQVVKDGGRGVAGRLVFNTTRSMELTNEAPAKYRGVRVVENAKDSSRLSPTAPAFTPSMAQAPREEAKQDFLSINLPAEDSLLEDSSANSRIGETGSGSCVDAKHWQHEAATPLSPSAQSFAPNREAKSLKGKVAAACGHAALGGVKPPLEQDLQVLVRLVGELKSPSREASKPNDREQGEERSRGVERLRRALLQHLAQQALLLPTETEGAQGSLAGGELGAMGTTSHIRSASQVLSREEQGVSRESVEVLSQMYRPGLSAAAKEFVPSSGGTASMSEMALLDPDTLSTSSCDPLLLLESLAEAAAQSRVAKKCSRFFPSSPSTHAPATQVAPEEPSATQPAAATSTRFNTCNPHEANPPQAASAQMCSCLWASKATSLPWTMALLTSLRTSPPVPVSKGTSSSRERSAQEKDTGAHEQSMAAAVEGVIGAWAEWKGGDAEGLLGLLDDEIRVEGMDRPPLPAIPMRRLADLVLAADADCMDQSPRSQDLSEIEQFLPPDLLDPLGCE